MSVGPSLRAKHTETSGHANVALAPATAAVDIDTLAQSLLSTDSGIDSPPPLRRKAVSQGCTFSDTLQCLLFIAILGGGFGWAIQGIVTN
jgi:hypothetical protein